MLRAVKKGPGFRLQKCFLARNKEIPRVFWKRFPATYIVYCGIKYNVSIINLRTERTGFMTPAVYRIFVRQRGAIDLGESEINRRTKMVKGKKIVLYFNIMVKGKKIILYFNIIVYSPFHKTLPKSSLQMHWNSVRFYEMSFRPHYGSVLWWMIQLFGRKKFNNFINY